MGKSRKYEVKMLGYIILLTVSFVCAFAATWVVKKMAIRKGYFDKPASRKVHTREIPTLGGIAIWLGFNIGMIMAFWINPLFRYEFLWRFCGLSAATLMLLLTGIYDDLHDLKAIIKLIIHIFAALILISFGFEIHIISGPAGSVPLGVLSIFITVLWIVGMINAINLIDGLDGLAAGVCGIAVFFLFAASVQVQNTIVAFLAVCLLGALLGFLPHNFYPAKIFMGNTGSMFLGIILSVLAILGFQKKTTVFTLFVPILAMAIPILDTFLSIIRRMAKRRPIFKADKEHIHHKLLVEEKSHPKVVLSLYFLTFCFGLIALSFSRLKGIYGMLALVLVTLVTFKWLKDWGFLDFK